MRKLAIAWTLMATMGLSAAELYGQGSGSGAVGPNTSIPGSGRMTGTVNGGVMVGPSSSVPATNFGAGINDRVSGRTTFGASAGAQAGARTARQAMDLRMQFYNGVWWYFMPNRSWVMWNGNNWIPYIPAAPAGGTVVVPYTTAYGSPTSFGAMAPSSGGVQSVAPAWRGDPATYGWGWGPGVSTRAGTPGTR